MRRRLSIFLLCAYSLCALAGDNREISFENLHRGADGSIEDTSIVTVNDQSEWEELWLARHDDRPSITGAPVVDFGTHFVLAFYLGTRPSGGYGVEISRIVAVAGKATLYVTETYPAKGCIVTTSVTAPYHLVVLTRQATWDAVDFALTRMASDCS